MSMPRLKQPWIEGPEATCINCGPLPVEKFYRHKSGRPLKRCKVCQCALQLGRYKDMRENDPRKILDWSVRFRYGLSLAEYEAKLESQNYKCMICSRDASEFKKGLGLDHNHATGQRRDFLCSPCNFMIGVLESDLRPLGDAYLERHNGD